MGTKDFFSSHSKVYAAFRPTYPEAIYEFIFKHLKNKTTAWDCATGNGQVAQYLSRHFEKVYATDISQQQLDHAIKAKNILYAESPAEKTSFPGQSFDLITVAQALHWFQAEAFYTEVKRLLKPEGLIAIWGYSLCTVNPEIDALFLHFYRNIVGPYWDIARKLVEDEYRNIHFPFAEIPSPKFQIVVTWTLDHYTGYLESWSATQKYMQDKGFNPVIPIRKDLEKHWKKTETMGVRFPVFLRLGKIRA